MPNGVSVAPMLLMPAVWARSAICCGPAMIGAEHDNDVRDARLRQHVAVEAPKPAVTAHIMQDAVAAEPIVHYADRSACAGDEPPRQLIGPTAEGVDRRDVAVGQRVAERDYCERVARGEHVDAAKERTTGRSDSPTGITVSAAKLPGGEM